MLVVQVTPVSLLASGLDRVLAVVAGVLLAVGFSAVAPLAWWSLGLLILVAITIGQVLRLRSNLIEVAISAMLVLGVGALGAASAAWQRIAETLVGAAVGIAANLLFPPKVASADAGTAIDELADTVSELLARAADELRELAPVGRRRRPGRARLAGAGAADHPHIPRVEAARGARGAGPAAQRPRRRYAGRRTGAAPGAGVARAHGRRRPRDAARGGRRHRRRVVAGRDTAEDVYLGLAQTFRRWPPASTRSGSWCGTRPTPADRLTADRHARGPGRPGRAARGPGRGSTTCSPRPLLRRVSSCTSRCSPPSRGCWWRWTSTSGSAVSSGCCAAAGPDPARRARRRRAGSGVGAVTGRRDAGAADRPPAWARPAADLTSSAREEAPARASGGFFTPCGSRSG